MQMSWQDLALTGFLYHASSILCTGGWLSNIYINNWSVIFLFEKRWKNKYYKLFHFQINKNLWKIMKAEISISIVLYFKSFIIFQIRSFNSSQTQSDGWCAEGFTKIKAKTENGVVSTWQQGSRPTMMSHPSRIPIWNWWRSSVLIYRFGKSYALSKPWS